MVAITDESGIEKARFRYDPFGKQYTVPNQSAINQTPVTAWLEDTQRGFTGHEMLNSVDIIHMNGRIYDANIGRFMQADAYIQAPKNMQSMNRYSYVLNNPLSYTDPSGHFFKSIKKYWRTIAAITITVLCYGTCAPVVAGFLAGAVQTGSLKGAIVGAFTAGIFQGIGDAFKNIANANYAASMDFMTKGMENGGLGLNGSTAELFASRGLTTAQQVGKVLSHAVTGGAMSSLNGGKFGNGFLSAGVTQAFSKTIQGISANGGKRIVAAAVLGGVTSAATGGKFANGAVTAAFSRAFNDESHPDYSKARNHDELLAMIKGENYILSIDNYTIKPVGWDDFTELLYLSFKKNLVIKGGVEIAHGSGATALVTTNLDFDLGYETSYNTGVMGKPFGSVGADVYSSGPITGFYQSVEFCAIGCISVEWNYINWSVGTSLTAGGGFMKTTGYKGSF